MGRGLRMGVGRGKMRGNGQEERAEGPGRGAGKVKRLAVEWASTRAE